MHPYSIKSILTLFFGLIFGALFAQQQIIATATQFITAGQFARGDKYLDSILKMYPKNTDALVMKGNLLLNYSWLNTSQNYFDTLRAESIFDTSASIDQSFFTPVIPDDTSRLIEKYWLRCLSIDSTRLDVKKGLCSLYSISRRTGDLKAQLWRMREIIQANPDNAFVYAEYARNLKARGNFAEGMEVYQFIASMFPNLAGIRCDMAGEYFYAGKLNEALQYLDSTMNEKSVDQTSFINSAAIYSLLGYYDNALKVLQRYSAQDTVLSGIFYMGLLQFANMSRASLMSFELFLQKANPQNYFDEVRLARNLLPYYGNGFTLQTYRQLIADSLLPDYYKVLIYQRGIQQFGDSCEVMMNFGLFQCRYKNNSAATQFLSEAGNCNTDTKQRDYWLLASGYAFYLSGDKEKSFSAFSAVVNADEQFVRQAAQYFSAKILLAEGNKAEAEELFRRITWPRSSNSSSKYRFLAAYYLATIK